MSSMSSSVVRPVTCTEGTNRLIKPSGLVAAAREALGGQWIKGKRPDLWDGRVAERAAKSLHGLLYGSLPAD